VSDTHEEEDIAARDAYWVSEKGRPSDYVFMRFEEYGHWTVAWWWRPVMLARLPWEVAMLVVRGDGSVGWAPGWALVEKPPRG
jgi:hypothetical protein